MSSPFSDLLDGFGLGDFFGRGSVAPESVARKVLGINGDRPLDKAGIAAAFRFRIKQLRPDLSDDQADKLRVKDIVAEEQLPEPGEWQSAGEYSFDTGSKQEQLAELMWAREDLLRRVPPPVTGTGGGSPARDTPTTPVTEWGKRQKRQREERQRARAEHEERKPQLREERERRQAEYRREARKESRRRSRERRAQRKPSDLRCRECRQVIDRDDVTIVGCTWGEEFILDPYTSPSWRWSVGPHYHAACLLDLPVRPSGWLERYLADGVPLETECAVCGRLVKPPRWVKSRDGGKVFFCSEGCAGGADAIARRVTRQPQNCEVCDEEFEPARSDARYCSDACRQDAYRQRKAGRL